jgi:predicted DNA-binding protein
MSTTPRKLAGLTADEAVSLVMNNDISDLLDQAQPVRERRPAKLVTALRVDLETQRELEAAALARGIGVSTLMRQIIEDWVQANRDTPLPGQISELVRHLDAARQAASSLASRNAA